MGWEGKGEGGLGKEGESDMVTFVFEIIFLPSEDLLQT